MKATVSGLGSSPAITNGSEEAALVAIAVDETDRLERLVTKVLELSRIHAGALQPSAEPTDVGELAGVAVRRMRHLARGRTIRLAGGEELLIVTVDPSMIELVFVVLLKSATATRRRGRRSSCEPTDAGADAHYKLPRGRPRPRDPGRRPGARLRGVRAARRPWTRLGTGAHDHACAGRGAQREDLGGDDAGWRGDGGVLAARRGDRMTAARVMLVEDDGALRAALVSTLRTHGFTAIQCTSAEEAIVQLDLTPAELVLLDLALPGPTAWNCSAASVRSAHFP